MARSTREPLSRARAIAAAVALADERGLGALSMRRLAKELGVEAMSLYHHVDGKDDILDGMVDAVFAEIDVPRSDAGWRPAMRERAVSQRAALVRHPWALRLLESRTSPGPETLRHHDAVIGLGLEAGFSLAMTAHAVAVLDAYVYGFVLQEQTLPFDDGDDVEPVVGEILAGMDAERFPHLARMAAEHVSRPGYRFADEFPFGLDLVLDGLVAASGRR